MSKNDPQTKLRIGSVCERGGTVETGASWKWQKENRVRSPKSNFPVEGDGTATNNLPSKLDLGDLTPEVELPEHANLDPNMILWAEANAALTDPIQSQPASLVRQDRVLRQNAVRLLPAKEYLEAHRVRTLLMHEMARVMSKVDVYVLPFDYADYTPNPVATLNTLVTNLTGQPCVVVPHGFNEKGNPTSLTFVGRVFGEADMLLLAKAYQDSTEWCLRHPKLGARS